MTRETPLHAVHERLGASFTDFAGYQMPVRYSSDLAEHHAVRQGAGLFDLSHMAEIECEGSQVEEFLDYALSNTLSALVEGQAKYSLLLAEDGGVIDDLIVYRLGEQTYLIVANAANRDAAVEAMQIRSAGFDVQVSDTSDDWALIALQGPLAAGILESSPVTLEKPLSELRYYRIMGGSFGSHDVLIARTGYTGEDGMEIFIHSAQAESLWRALMETGGDQLTLCGLACRDTLRLEAGMPLYGHELSRTVTPAQSGLSGVVVNTKESFIGKDQALGEKSSRVLVGLSAEGKRAPRAEYSVLDGEGVVVGEITSGALSPTLGFPIAMAFVEAAYREPGTVLAVDVRGASLPVTVTSLPFYSRKKVTS
jgi:aminomethyltransferase